MRILLDSQAIIWSVDQHQQLSNAARTAISDPMNDLFVGAGTIWEIAIKVGISKLSLSLPYYSWMTKAISDLGLFVLPITLEYADRQSSLPHHHRDPFDRLLAAQAMVENIPIVSSDAQLDAYGIVRIW